LRFAFNFRTLFQFEEGSAGSGVRLKMSIVPKETIEVIAQSIGINTLSPDVALAVAPDVEYRMRQIMQVSSVLFVLQL